MDAYVEFGEEIGLMLRAYGALRCVAVLVGVVALGADIYMYFA